MKPKFLSSVLLAVALLATLPANAYDFMVDDIAYNITGDGTVEVTDGGSYSGDIIIPSSVTYEGTNYSVTAIGNNSFTGCHGLMSVTIPNSVTDIGGRAFAVCDGLTSIQVESGNMVYDSLNNCNAIIETASNTLIAGCKNTIIPNSVTTIGNYAFFGCRGLTTVAIPNSVKTISHEAFVGCCGLTTVTIPNSVTDIGDGVFNGCSGLTTVTIPNSVTDIGDRAFAACSALTTVAIPNSVTDIGNFTFWGCSGLMSVTIPNSVTDIDDYAFSDCSGLTSIYAYPDPSKVAIGEDIFYNVEKSACVLHVPSDFLDAYKASPQWKEFEHIEPLR